jgi:ribosomal protein S18 acetylase RimI-like enzyme
VGRELPGEELKRRQGSLRATRINPVSTAVSTPRVGELDQVIEALRRWQREGSPIQLHPGDIGWFWRFGQDAIASALRVWSRDGEVVAVGLLDEPNLLRMTTDPELRDDGEFAGELADHLDDPERGVLPPGQVYLEAPADTAVHVVLSGRGWEFDAAYTPLCRQLSGPVEDSGLRIEVATEDTAKRRAAVQRASFDNSTFSEEAWRLMAAGPAYKQARCLIAYDENDEAVAAATIWSAGRGRPGLLEPVGVHRDHRRRGYGRAITLAAAAALFELGSSSAVVCTPSSNVAAVATYASAGFEILPERLDRKRPA